MRNMHPHWQPEDETSVPVTVRQKQETSVPQPESAPRQISRRPAAFVGMAIVVGAGFMFFRGVEGLTGQLSPGQAGEHIVSISETGISPERLEVEHGQTITWINRSTVPQSVVSETLCSDTGFCLRTSILEQGQSDSFTITPDMRSGTYRYASPWSPEITGEIVIVTEAVDDFTDITSVFGDEFARDVGPEPFRGIETEPEPTFTASANIPVNPYTVDGTRSHPFDASGEPIPEAFGDNAKDTAQTALRTSGGPLRQPSTGPEVWIVTIASIGLLAWSTRNIFATER